MPSVKVNARGLRGVELVREDADGVSVSDLGSAERGRLLVVLRLRSTTSARMYRSAGTSRAMYEAALLVVALLALAVLSSSARVVAIVLLVLALMVLWRIAGWGIKASSTGIKVGWLIGSRTVSWGEIDSFTVLPSGSYPWVGHVVLRDGRKLACLGVSSAGRPRTDARRLQVQGPVDALNELLRQRRGASAE